MAKHLNVNLSFTADTSQAKAQMQDLQNQLTKLINTSSFKTGASGLSNEIQKSVTAAAQLKVQLQEATNTKTGKLDLTRFNDSLRQSGMTLKDYQSVLSNLGPAGDQAFVSLARSISTADAPLRRTSKLLSEMGTTLKNTIKWQISSSAIHSFTGAMQSAYNYAQNLNRSLNDIRIVTGQSTEQMAEFAERANKAAKELSTTTTAYTNASLIYYQQGLNDEEVEARTNTTIKMANVTGENATAVSDYMTAIWNNFDDGSKSIEHYADVITALGAATASSSEEIAGGLEKFAAIADTVGMSYEYATTALATIVAQTRQSEDTVGTGLRTILSRFSSVTLGETLEDGVNLTKYTEALNTAGVKVLDDNGELKKMDEILNNIGEKWQTISDSQKTALAQTVGGVRQYTTIMALFDNWDVFKENLGVAQGSEGSLEEQAEIYAESWQAAQKRVRASAEAIYQDLLNDDFFIEINNVLADFLGLVDSAIDSFGGLKGVLAGVSVFVTKIFGDKVAESIRNMGINLRMLTKSGREAVEEQKQQTSKSLYDYFNVRTEKLGNKGELTSEQKEVDFQIANVYKDEGKSQLDLLRNAEKLSAEEQKIAQLLLDQQRTLGEQSITAKELVVQEKQRSESLKIETLNWAQTGKGSKNWDEKTTEDYENQTDALKEAIFKQEEYSNNLKKFESLTQSSKKGTKEYNDEFRKLGKTLGAQEEQIESYLSTEKDFNKVFNSIYQENKRLNNEVVKAQKDLTDIIYIGTKSRKESAAAGRDLAKQYKQEAQANIEAENATNIHSAAVKNFSNFINQTKVKVADYATIIVNAASSLSQLSMGISSLSTIKGVLDDKDLSTFNKFLQVFMSLGMGLPMLVNGFKNLSSVIATTSKRMAIYYTTQLLVNSGIEAEAAAQQAAKDVKEVGALASMKIIALHKLEAITSGEVTASILTRTAARAAELVLLHPYYTLLGLITLATFGLMAAYDEEAEKLENLKEKYDATTQAAQDAKQAYDNITSAKDNLDSLIDTLNGCTKGTQEWKEALFNVNQQVLELINKYPDLAKYMTNENGRLSIAEEGWDELISNQQAAANASVIAQARANTELKAEQARQKSEDLADQTHGAKYKITQVTDRYGAGSYNEISPNESYGNLSTEQLNALTKLYAENSALFDKEHNSEIIKELSDRGIKIDSDNLEGFLNNKFDILTENQKNLAEVEAAQTAETTSELNAFTSKLSQYNIVGDQADTTAQVLAIRNRENYDKAYQNVSELSNAEIEERIKSIFGYNTLEGTKFEDFEDNEEIKETLLEILANTDSINSLTEIEANAAAKTASSAEARSMTNFLSSGIMSMKSEDYKTINSEYNKGNTEVWSKEEAKNVLIKAYGLDPFDKEKLKEDLNAIAEQYGYTTSTSMLEAISKGLNKGEEQLGRNYYGQIYERNTQMKSEQISTNNLDSDVVESQAENIVKYGDALDYNTKALEENENAAKQLAINNQMMDKGVKALNEDWEEWKKVLKSTDKTTADYAETVEKVSDSLGDMLNIAKESDIKDVIDADFINENLEDIEKAAKGDEKAIQRLGQAVATDYVDSLEESVKAQQEVEKAALDTNETMNDQQYMRQLDKVNNVYQEKINNINNVKSAMNDLTNSINSGALKAGDSLEKLSGFNTADFANKLNQMAIDTGMSVADMQSMLNSLHLDAQITTTQQIQKTTVPIYETTEWYENDGTEEITYTVDNDGNQKTAKVPKKKKYSKTDVVGYTEGHEVIDVPQIAFNGNNPGAAPITYLGRGSVSPSVSSSGSKGKSGGGGGGSKAPEHKSANRKTTNDMKNVSDETERYHVLNNQLEDLEDQLNKISSAKDRAFGKNRIKYINEEIDKYDDLIAKDEEYLKAVENNLKKDKAAIAAYGATFDQNGTITNYEALMKAQIDKANSGYATYNSYIDQYNNLSGAAQEARDKQYEAMKDADGNFYSGYEDYLEKTYIEPADKNYDNFVKALEQYEETQDLYKEKSEKLVEDMRAKYDAQLEGVEYEVEVKVMVEDDSLEYLDFLLSKVEDRAHETAEAIAILGNETESFLAKSQINESGIQNIFANHGLTENDFNAFKAGNQDIIDRIGEMDFTDDEVQTLRDYRSELISMNEELMETRRTIHEKVRDAFDEFNNELDEGIDKIETYKSITEEYLNIVDLVGQKNLGIANDILNEMGQSVVDQANNKLKSTVDKRDAIEKERDAAQEALNEAKRNGYEEDVKEWEQTLKEMNNALLDAEEEVLSAWEDALTAANEAFEKSVQLSINSLSAALGGLYANADELSEAFDRQKDIDDQHLEDFEQIYQLTKLTREINNAIDDTDNIKGKQELAELLDEINTLEERREQLGENISEYDLEYLQKKLELKRAEIAMEDSQNAKSQVRMSRTYDGSWSYVYTANEEEVAAAEQSYEDKLYEMQRLNADYINTLQDNIVQMQTEMTSKLQEIATDESLSIEERQAKMDEVQAYYKEKMDYYSDEMGKVMNNNKELYNEDWQEYSVAHDYKIADDQRYVDSFNETALSTLSGYETMEQFQENFNNAIGAPGQSGSYLDDLDQAFKIWEQNTEETMNNAKTSMEEFSNTIQEEVQILEDKSNEAADNVTEMSETVVNDMQEIIDAVDNWENQYSNTVDAILTKNEALVKSFNAVLQAWAGYKQGTGTNSADETTNPNADAGSGAAGNSGRSGDGQPAVGDKVTFVSGSYYEKSTGEGRRGSQHKNGQVYITYMNPGAAKPIHISTKSRPGPDSDLGWLTKEQLSGYDTGGYTGAWGNDGRLALLHEKELVLNKDDTENFLKIVDMVRQISQVIDLNAGAASSYSLTGMFMGGINGSAQSIQQEIHINADFPNATDRDEIKAAFESLAISAAQYANRR